MLQLVKLVLESVLPKLGEKLVEFGLSEKDKASFESLQEKISLLHARASDIDEQIKKAEQSGKKKRKREVHVWLEVVQTIGNELHALENETHIERFVKEFFGGGGIGKLEARVLDLVEQSRHFGEFVLDDCDVRGEPLLTKGLVGRNFKKNLDNILNLLLVDKVSSIGIHGMGGVGKTTLAKHVNNQLLEQNQECVGWITVSQEFTIKMLQDEMAKFLRLDLSNEQNEDKRAVKLNKRLSKIQNLVFIFDDVWENINLEMLGDPLSVSGCRLLITTRLHQVCKQMDCEQIIKVKTLEEGEAWNLFKATLGRGMNLTLEVQKIAKSMVEICDGLPLGIITIAGSMKGETDLHVWSDAWAELREYMVARDDIHEKVFKVLKYSFDRLDRHGGKNIGYSKFHHCFLYCSLYPEDFIIPRKMLIRKFIQEDFLDKRKTRKELVCQGHAILDKLVKVCLIEEMTYHDEMNNFVRAVKMHDLVRAMALQITEGKTKVKSGNRSLIYIPKEEVWVGLDKMSLMYSDIRTISDGVSPNCPNLSTLLLEGNPRLEFIANSFFLQMSSLSILDLSSTGIKKLPDSLSDMVSLKALLLASCRELEYVPYLGELKELKELDLTDTAIQEVPRGMEELFNLKFLSLQGSNQLKLLPSGSLLKLQHLQCLLLPIHIQAPGDEIGQLKHLEEFQGLVKDASNFNQLKPWLASSLAYFIKVGEGSPYNRYPFRFFGYNQLEFCKYTFNSRESKDAIVLAQDVQHLVFLMCKGLSSCFAEDLPRLNNPTSTQRLDIFNCGEIEYLMRQEQFEDRGTVISAPPPHAFFSSLSLLRLIQCHQMKKLGLLASQLQNLKELEILDCGMMEDIIEVSEDIQGGGGEPKESSVVSLPKLENLTLHGLPGVKSICNATVICSCIKSISLFRCPELEKLPIVFEQPNYDSIPSTFEKICVSEREKEWWEKLEVGHPSHHSLLRPFIVWF